MISLKNIFLLGILFFHGNAGSANEGESRLKCFVCGSYNDGDSGGSITPCLKQGIAALELKECPRKTDKYCVKYVSELSTVRDCVENCVENDSWDVGSTTCCNHDGCNGAEGYHVSRVSKILIISSFFFIFELII